MAPSLPLCGQRKKGPLRHCVIRRGVFCPGPHCDFAPSRHDPCAGRERTDLAGVSAGTLAALRGERLLPPE